jgi:hypothetical protein
LSLFLVCEHAADCFNRLIDPARNFPRGGFQSAGTRRRMIEFACKPRPIGAERVDLGDERILPTIELAPPVRRRFQRIKSKRQALAGELDGIVVAHLAILGGHRHREPHVKTVRPQQFTHGSLRRIELQRQRPKQLSSAPVHDARGIAAAQLTRPARMLSDRRLFT